MLFLCRINGRCWHPYKLSHITALQQHECSIAMTQLNYIHSPGWRTLTTIKASNVHSCVTQKTNWQKLFRFAIAMLEKEGVKRHHSWFYYILSISICMTNTCIYRTWLIIIIKSPPFSIINSWASTEDLIIRKQPLFLYFYTNASWKIISFTM